MKNDTIYPCIIIGGGPAGFFAGCLLKQKQPDLDVLLLEKSQKLLTKVALSGNGRCNLTNSCFDPKKLVENYPRGSKELLGPFHTFGPHETIEWFEAHEVGLKTEQDGRIFPVSNSAQTIIDCLLKEAKGLTILRGVSVEKIEKTKDEPFILHLNDGEILQCQRLLIATGSNPSIMKEIQTLGHTIEPLMPSLFTFNTPNSPLLDLAGQAVEKVSLKLFNFTQTGPVLLTHWGLSGPAILKLSSWAAKKLFESSYKADLHINWLGNCSLQDAINTISQTKKAHGEKICSSFCPFPLSKSFWKRFCELASITETTRWAYLQHEKALALCKKLTEDTIHIDGKSDNKDEFVTCGGVKLSEVNFKTMESRLIPNLYFAGEVLDIDGITGGFNLQNCWTTGFLAAEGMATPQQKQT